MIYIYYSIDERLLGFLKTALENLMLRVIAPDEPQKTKAKWRAEVTATGEQFLVGQTVGFSDSDGPHRGIYQTRVINEIPQLHYDRHRAEAVLGLWAHFMWPSVTAESGNGHHLILNTYDRARFTFGFYQLAAHTPEDNLILLFRSLLALDTSADYFPDLFLKNDRVHRRDGATTYSLETVTTVHRPNGKIEKQLVGFMTYLNPDTLNANEQEVMNGAKLMHWLLNDSAAMKTSEQVAFAIMHRKIKRLATAYKLAGKDPRLAIWISDIAHQGRGKAATIKAALKASTLTKQLSALSKVDIYNDKNPDGMYLSRRKSVQKSIKVLEDEQRFKGTALGDAKLSLD
ncbi:hypothetical protein [Bauldia litoralis]|uniref:hypothetical protein n=1 Tax=Bauldia litoralis TaxID=665467 RepID=UPI0032656CD8